MKNEVVSSCSADGWLVTLIYSRALYKLIKTPEVKTATKTAAKTANKPVVNMANNLPYTKILN